MSMEEDPSATASPLRVTAQFVDIQGNTTGPPLSLPINVSPEQLNGLLRELLENQRTSESRKDDEPDSATYSFFIHETELTYSIEDLIKRLSKSNEHVVSMETQLQIVYTPQALFKVRPVSRCSSTLSGMYTKIKLTLKYFHIYEPFYI
jgi:ribosome assembly protein 4